jgi:hypothetical protein
LSRAKSGFSTSSKAGCCWRRFRRRKPDYVLAQVRDVYPTMSAAKNILQTSLQNGNPVIHPAITLMNVALIERTKGDFDFYHQGVTPAVGRLVEGVDRERIAIGKKLGVEVIPDPELGVIQGYMTEATYDNGFNTAPGFAGVKAQPSLDYRYFNEDVGYGLVFLQKLGEQVGVETPVMSAVITLVSLLMNRDYVGEARRTMATLGLVKPHCQRVGETVSVKKLIVKLLYFIKEAPMEDFKRILYPVALTEISPKIAPYVVTLADNSMHRSICCMCCVASTGSWTRTYPIPRSLISSALPATSKVRSCPRHNKNSKRFTRSI